MTGPQRPRVAGSNKPRRPRGNLGSAAAFTEHIGPIGDPAGNKTVIVSPRIPGAPAGTSALGLLEAYRRELRKLAEFAEGIGATVPIIGAKARMETVIKEIRDAQYFADRAIQDLLKELMDREHRPDPPLQDGE